MAWYCVCIYIYILKTKHLEKCQNQKQYFHMNMKVPPHLKVWIRNSLITQCAGHLKLVYSLCHQYFAGGWVLPSNQGHRLGYEILFLCIHVHMCNVYVCACGWRTGRFFP